MNSPALVDGRARELVEVMVDGVCRPGELRGTGDRRTAAGAATSALTFCVGTLPPGSSRLRSPGLASPSYGAEMLGTGESNGFWEPRHRPCGAGRPTQVQPEGGLHMLHGAKYCITCGRELVEFDGEQRCPQGCAPAGPPPPQLSR